MIAGICGLAAAASALGADTFDGVYTGKRVLTKALSLNCEPSDDVSVTIQGGAVTFTNSVLRDFSIAFNPHQTGLSAWSPPSSPGTPCRSGVA